MIVRTIIGILLAAWAWVLTMRHNMHMLQLNGYKNDEQITWIKKNMRQQWLLGFGLVLGVIRLFFPFLWLDILIYLTLLLDIQVYRALRRLNTKKKLVYTARVKRMIATLLILSGAAVALTLIFAGLTPLVGVLMLLVSGQWFLNMAANLINHPMEKAVSNYYINDAKKKLRERPDLTVIGITGSYGKTSVKYYLQTLLSSRYHVLVTPGNYNTPLGVTKTVRELLKPTHEIFLCEMGARRVGDIREVCEIAHPMHGIITSIGPQHLETFFNMENIQKTKFELADALPEGGELFLNGDNSYIQEKAAEYPRKTFYYAETDNGGESEERVSENGNVKDSGRVAASAGTERKSEAGEPGYAARDIVLSQVGTEFTVVTPEGETERFQMRLIGGHNVINVVGAIAVAHRMGIPLKDLKIPVRRIQSVEHRMEMKEHGNVTIIDDAYNSNPVGSKAAVETLAMFEGIRILITPGMVELGEKEEEFNYKFGTYAAACCDHILLVGRRHTEPIRRGALDSGFPEEKLRVYDKLEEAMAYAYAIKGEGHKYILLENDLPDNYG